MRLKDLLPESEIDLEITGVSTNSKTTKKGDLFLCIKGICDRHDYIEEARENGAIAAVVSKDINTDLYTIKVEDVDKIKDDILEKFYDYPDQKIKIIGITGTDGKTSSAMIIQQLLGDDICGYIGTNGIHCKGYDGESANTTPSKEELLKIFDIFLKKGMRYVAMEASSEAFYYKRLNGLKFYRAGLTNITSEHLNTHKTLENYIASKKELFKANIGYSILNKDDKYYAEFSEISRHVLTYGKGSDNDLQIKGYNLYPDKTDITFHYKNKDYQFTSPLIGSFNVYNLALAFEILISLNIEIEDIIKKINHLHIPGRMEYINCGQDYKVIVDYAHTANGVRNFMDFIKTIPHNHIIAVSGQAGGRDSSKRKYVGENIARNADLAIWTLEDPRFEKVNDIAADMSANIQDLNNYIVIEDRREAIKYAIKQAEKDDIVVILGKGAETSNVIGEEDIDYIGDIKCAELAIKERNKFKIK